MMITDPVDAATLHTPMRTENTLHPNRYNDMDDCDITLSPVQSSKEIIPTQEEKSITSAVHTLRSPCSSAVVLPSQEILPGSVRVQTYSTDGHVRIPPRRALWYYLLILGCLLLVFGALASLCIVPRHLSFENNKIITTSVIILTELILGAYLIILSISLYIRRETPKVKSRGHMFLTHILVSMLAACIVMPVWVLSQYQVLKFGYPLRAVIYFWNMCVVNNMVIALLARQRMICEIFHIYKQVSLNVYRNTAVCLQIPWILVAIICISPAPDPFQSWAALGSQTTLLFCYLGYMGILSYTARDAVPHFSDFHHNVRLWIFLATSWLFLGILGLFLEPMDVDIVRLLHADMFITLYTIEAFLPLIRDKKEGCPPERDSLRTHSCTRNTGPDNCCPSARDFQSGARVTSLCGRIMSFSEGTFQ